MVEPLQISRRAGLGLALVQARRGVAAATIGAALKIEATQYPARRGNGEVALTATGPGTWLLEIACPEENWVTALNGKLEGLAYVTDQSAGYVVMRVAGERARVLLQSGVSIDLHPSHFGVGSAVSTAIAHIGVLLSQVDDRPSFDLAFFRSFTASMEHWIAMASAAHYP